MKGTGRRAGATALLTTGTAAAATLTGQAALTGPATLTGPAFDRPVYEAKPGHSPFSLICCTCAAIFVGGNSHAPIALLHATSGHA